MKQLISFLLCALLLCGCSIGQTPYIPSGDALADENASPIPTPPPEKEQSLSMVYYPDSPMNPYTATEYTNRALLPLLYQGLFYTDSAYRTVPVLCEEYHVSADMKTHTVTLAPARFSDGTALTAQDVVASLSAAKASGYYSGRFLHIVSFTAQENSVIFQTDTPFENLPCLLDIPIVKSGEVNAEIPLGTGPYLLENSVGGSRLRRQAAWWCIKEADLVITAPYIPLVKAESPSQIRDQFEFDDVGLVCADPGSDHYADYRCDYEIWDCETGLFLYLVTSSRSAVFSNPAVRRALTHAIDRDLLVEEYYRGFARSATLPASPLSPYYDNTLASRYTYDMEKFQTALTEAQMQGASVTMLLNSDDSLRLRVGRKIAQMLRDCGLTVNVSEMDSNTFLEHVKWGTYDLYLAQTKLSPNMDLSPFFRPGGNLSYGGLSANTTAYALSLKALENRGNFYNLHEVVMEDGQLCPILVRSYAIYATRGLVTDLSPARDNLFFYTLGKTLADVTVS